MPTHTALCRVNKTVTIITGSTIYLNFIVGKVIYIAIHINEKNPSVDELPISEDNLKLLPPLKAATLVICLIIGISKLTKGDVTIAIREFKNTNNTII